MCMFFIAQINHSVTYANFFISFFTGEGEGSNLKDHMPSTNKSMLLLYLNKHTCLPVGCMLHPKSVPFEVTLFVTFLFTYSPSPVGPWNIWLRDWCLLYIWLQISHACSRRLSIWNRLFGISSNQSTILIILYLNLFYDFIWFTKDKKVNCSDVYSGDALDHIRHVKQDSFVKFCLMQ